MSNVNFPRTTRQSPARQLQRVHGPDAGAGPPPPANMNDLYSMYLLDQESNGMNDFFRNFAPAVQGADAGAGPPPPANMNDLYSMYLLDP